MHSVLDEMWSVNRETHIRMRGWISALQTDSTRARFFRTARVLDKKGVTGHLLVALILLGAVHAVHRVPVFIKNFSHGKTVTGTWTSLTNLIPQLFDCSLESIANIFTVVIADEAVLDGEEIVLVALPWDRATGVAPDVSRTHTFRIDIDELVIDIDVGNVLTGYPGAVQRKNIAVAVVGQCCRGQRDEL